MSRVELTKLATVIPLVVDAYDYSISEEQACGEKGYTFFGEHLNEVVCFCPSTSTIFDYFTDHVMVDISDAMKNAHVTAALT